MEYYKTLQLHYEKKLAEHGPNAKGMDWPNQEDLNRRFEVLTSIATNEHNASLLDLGCGVGLLIDYLQNQDLLHKFEYRGADISSKMVSIAAESHPEFSFEVRDVLVNPYPTESVDYIVMNGVLTEKQDMAQSQMIEFAQNIILSTFKSCKKGIAFNVMSSHVDWQRDDLFHWELDEIVGFLVKNCSRNIRIMMDYGLYEYTVHLKK